MIKPAKQELERELGQLVALRERCAGLDMKRINYKIAQLQSRIDHLKANEAI